MPYCLVEGKYDISGSWTVSFHKHRGDSHVEPQKQWSGNLLGLEYAIFWYMLWDVIGHQYIDNKIVSVGQGDSVNLNLL